MWLESVAQDEVEKIAFAFICIHKSCQPDILNPRFHDPFPLSLAWKLYILRVWILCWAYCYGKTYLAQINPRSFRALSV